MNKLKYLICLVTAVLWTAAASAQTFYYRGSEKVPLVLQPGRKAILCDAKAEITLPHKGDKLHNTFRSESLVTVIYDETDSLAPLTNSFKSKKSLYSTYECYYMNSLKATPSGYIHVQLKNLSDTILLKTICEKFDCVIERPSRSYPEFYRIRIIPGEGRNPVNIANQIYETGFFLSAEPIFWVEVLQDISYDPLTQEQWGLYNYSHPGMDISVSTAWNYSTGRNIKIAIIDGGVDIYHEDLLSRIYNSYDAESEKSPCQTTDAHGTRCAGIAAATRNNNKLISGVAPDALLMPVSIKIGTIESPEFIVKAIQWCWQNGADIISCSLSLPYYSEIVNAFKEAATLGRNGKGCVIVSSAGNIRADRPDLTEITFPATLPEVMAVGNMRNDGLINYDSCYGSNMWVVAPGTQIVSLIPNNKYDIKSGTSYACPHVAGVTALMLQRNPYLGWKEVRDIIKNTATKVGPLSDETPWDDHYGYGLVNAYQAVINTPRRLK